MSAVGEAWTDERLDDLNSGMHREFDQVHQEVRAVRTDLSAEIQAVRTDLGAEIRAVRTELGAEIRGVRTDLSAEIQAVRTDLGAEIRSLQLTMYVFMSSILGAVVAAIVVHAF
jgi:BMFP domain-containing protein YqiC